MDTVNITEQNIVYWNGLFARGPRWSRYPTEELVGFVARTYPDADRRHGLRALEVGCGPGPNLWYLAREGFEIAGIDGSANAVNLVRERLRGEGMEASLRSADLKVGNFASLPWTDGSFDLVIDIEAITHNTTPVICSVIAEIFRVLRPGGWFLSRMFHSNTTGIMSGIMVEAGTMRFLKNGPLVGCGLVHLFTEDELSNLLSPFHDVAMELIQRTSNNRMTQISEWVVQARRPERVDWEPHRSIKAPSNYPRGTPTVNPPE
jgi:2-polyprenyl-3-methyl-5-hydroxy-6-metoxy-1,4-benzoquinol methylase